MKFQEFRLLSPEAKNMEILKMLPLLTPLNKEFSDLKKSLSLAIDKVCKNGIKLEGSYFHWKMNYLELEFGVLSNKTWSVDDILRRQFSCPPSLISPSQFNSVDNIHR